VLRLQFSLSLAVFLVIVVAFGFLIGHGWSALGIAFFLFFLAGIDAKPSWKRIFDPDPEGEGGILRFFSWKGRDARPGEREKQRPFYR
jgi:hypothetical protein